VLTKIGFELASPQLPQSGQTIPAKDQSTGDEEALQRDSSQAVMTAVP